MAKVKMVCSTCGSEDVLKDAFAEWDFEKQEWVLQNTFDKGDYCQGKCDGETRIIEVAIEPEEKTHETQTASEQGSSSELR